MSAAPDHANLRTEIAAAAARLIAEEGVDYGRAKRRAAQLLLGAHSNSRSVLPDNSLVESELRRYLQTFAGDSHPALLAAMRRLAAQWLARLAHFSPHIVGSVLNGTATEHSDLHLHLFTDNAKDVEMYLLNERITFDVGEGAAIDDAGGGAMAAEEVVTFVVPSVPGSGLPARVGVVLAIHRSDAIRIAPRFRSSDASLHAVAASGRANAAQLAQLLAADSVAADSAAADWR